ncbi:hypothetical protein CBER1_11657 [Cercospora berteroae]|uniref:FAD-binding PCMH-type domain-containing protein n=1 Tax=Cercospora berteroae TaxID=357750 RepID=A0A2S6BZN9_9PEZI|nr:hypothetical protein CBER1_11657 [Cercospora berteroae]
MATLDSLKKSLTETASPHTKSPLTDVQYGEGFRVFTQDAGWTTYRDFVIPQLSQLFTRRFNLHRTVSVLEIGPGPRSILGLLANDLRAKIRRYTSFEPNIQFASQLEEWCSPDQKEHAPFPYLTSRPSIYRSRFTLDAEEMTETNAGTHSVDEKFDIVLFCHSMYGLHPTHNYIRRAIQLLAEEGRGTVAVFHRDNARHFEGLVCHQTASFPTGSLRVLDRDGVLDHFARFVAGYTLLDVAVDKRVRTEWRKICRAMGQGPHQGYLSFSSPSVMLVFDRNAVSLPELLDQMPLTKEERMVKNREARLRHPASIVRPTEIHHIQRCVRWALKYGHSLTVLGGGHSGHCLWRNTVAVDMDMFTQLSVIAPVAGTERSNSGPDAIVVAGAGCKIGDIIRKTAAKGLTVPLGSRPSVGAGLWLQGGIGHLSRLHGLACDSILGAVVVSVDSGELLCVGFVPSGHRPSTAVRPENEEDLLWALKGAGTNFGVVVSVTFKAYTAGWYSVRNWAVPLDNGIEARHRFREFQESIARRLPSSSSADVYLYWAGDRLNLGVILYEFATTKLTSRAPSEPTVLLRSILGREERSVVVDCLGLLETDMYMSTMHGGHASGKTSSFKRCLFLKHLAQQELTDAFEAAIRARPTPLCYLHIMQGGGAIAAVAADVTSFGCRDWGFACIVTAVWPRDTDECNARKAVDWVYSVAADLLPFACGAYSADLGRDLRDAPLAAQAFGPNGPRLAHLKQSLDPHKILAYACPLPSMRAAHKAIILVTGESGAGKDYCAKVWHSLLLTATSLTARVVSISEATKREYAASTGADLDRLFCDRAYKEEHRPGLTAFFKSRVRERPALPQEHFLGVVLGAADVDVLLITGMRDRSPVATFAHLVPGSMLLEVRVRASEPCCHLSDDQQKFTVENGAPYSRTPECCPDFVFDNDIKGSESALDFAKKRLLPLFHDDLQRLAQMVRLVNEFPVPGIDFRHVLDIAQQPGGLKLCTSLLQTHFTGDWTKVNVVACCEAGGFVFGAALADRANASLALIRHAGKLPPPTLAVSQYRSHVSSQVVSGSLRTSKRTIEINKDAIYSEASVLVVDDVLATGNTLSAMLMLLHKAGVPADRIHVMIVAEFPAHRGREMLRQHGFGNVHIRSLLVFNGR